MTFRALMFDTNGAIMIAGTDDVGGFDRAAAAEPVA